MPNQNQVRVVFAAHADAQAKLREYMRNGDSELKKWLATHEDMPPVITEVFAVSQAIHSLGIEFCQELGLEFREGWRARETAQLAQDLATDAVSA